MNLSIVTPTYNRAGLLPILFESLQKQTNKGFEWIIIDDGSSDNTGDLVKTWLADADFNIKYYYKKNGGKHSALNYSHKYIDSEITLIVDSDDWLVPNAVDIISKDWNRYRDDETICGITYLRGEDPHNSLKGRHFRKQEEISDYISIKVNDKNDCGSCEVIRTAVLKEFPFPVINNEKFIGESYLWFNAGFRYRTVYIDKILYITEYYSDGLTKAGHKLRFNNPVGSMIISNFGMNQRIRFPVRIKHSILYNCYAFKANISIKKRIKMADNKTMAFLGILPGLLLFYIWTKDYS